MSTIEVLDRDAQSDLELVDLDELKARLLVTGSSEDPALQRLQRVVAGLMAQSEGLARVWWRGQVVETITVHHPQRSLWPRSAPIESIDTITTAAGLVIDAIDYQIVEGDGIRRISKPWARGRYAVQMWAGWATPSMSGLPTEAVQIPEDLDEVIMTLCEHLWRQRHARDAGVSAISDVTGKTVYRNAPPAAIPPWASAAMEQWRRDP